MGRKNFRQRLLTIINLPKSIPLLWRLLKDKRVPKANKALFVGVVVAYFLFPFDVFLDSIPLLGQIDDLTVLLFLWERFLSKVPPPVLEDYERLKR